MGKESFLLRNLVLLWVSHLSHQTLHCFYRLDVAKLAAGLALPYSRKTAAESRRGCLLGSVLPLTCYLRGDWLSNAAGSLIWLSRRLLSWAKACYRRANLISYSWNSYSDVLACHQRSSGGCSNLLSHQKGDSSTIAIDFFHLSWNCLLNLILLVPFWIEKWFDSSWTKR